MGSVKSNMGTSGEIVQSSRFKVQSPRSGHSRSGSIQSRSGQMARGCGRARRKSGYSALRGEGKGEGEAHAEPRIAAKHEPPKTKAQQELRPPKTRSGRFRRPITPLRFAQESGQEIGRNGQKFGNSLAVRESAKCRSEFLKE